MPRHGKGDPARAESTGVCQRRRAVPPAWETPSERVELRSADLGVPGPCYLGRCIDTANAERDLRIENISSRLLGCMRVRNVLHEEKSKLSISQRKVTADHKFLVSKDQSYIPYRSDHTGVIFFFWCFTCPLLHRGLGNMVMRLLGNGRRWP